DRNVTGVQTCALPICFALMNMEGFMYEDMDLSGDLLLADKWILTRLNETIQSVTYNTDKYEFREAGRYLYNFIWDELCDWYIERSEERRVGKGYRVWR